MFKSMIPYELEESIELNLESHRFVDITPAQLESVGWVEPEEELVFQSGGTRLICLRKDEKIIPASVIKKETDKRIESLGGKLSRTEIAELKEDVAADLALRAFTKTTLTHCIITDKMLYVEAGSPSKADEFTAYLRSTIGSLPCVPVCTVSSAMFTSWIVEKAPEDFVLGSEAVLVDEEKQKATLSKHNLQEDDVLEHINEGKLVKKIGLTYGETFSFTIDDDMCFKKIKFEYDDSSEDDNFVGNLISAQMEFDAVMKAFDKLGG